MIEIKEKFRFIQNLFVYHNSCASSCDSCCFLLILTFVSRDCHDLGLSIENM
jgi:hypothetical protein